MLSAVPKGQYTPAGGDLGAYNSAASVSATASVLHAVHTSSRWPGDIPDAFGSKCAGCHAPAACEMCHTPASLPAAGGSHQRHDDLNPSDAADYAWPYQEVTLAQGSSAATQTDAVALTTTSFTCTTPGCHTVGNLATDNAYGVPWENWVASGITQIENPLDPANNTVTYSGTGWRAYDGWGAYTAGKQSRNTGVNGQYAQFIFTGGRIKVIADKDQYRGQFRVEIDGVNQGTFSQYAGSTQFQQTIYDSLNTTPGLNPTASHTIRVIALGTRDGVARANYITIDQFRVFPGAANSTPAGYAGFCGDCHNGSQVYDATDRRYQHDGATFSHEATLQAGTYNTDLVLNTTANTQNCVGPCHSNRLTTIVAGTGEHDLAKSSTAGKSCVNCHQVYATQPDGVDPEWNATCSFQNTSNGSPACHGVGTPREPHVLANVNASHTVVPADDPSGCTTVGCHVGRLDQIHNNSTGTFSTNCLTCHAYAKWSSLNANSRGCNDPKCHTVFQFSNHPYIAASHNASSTTQAGVAYTGGYACSQCHKLELKPEHDKPLSGPVDCATCHGKSYFPTTWSDTTANKQCVACHTTGQAAVPHADASTKHGVIGTNSGACAGSDCHTVTDVAGVHKNNCTRCHVTNDTVPTANTCWSGTCHGGTSTYHDQTAAHTGAVNTECTSCHPTYANVATGHGNGGSCAKCHANALLTSSGTVYLKNTTYTDQCISCHRVGAIGGHAYSPIDANHSSGNDATHTASNDANISVDMTSAVSCTYFGCHSTTMKTEHAVTRVKTMDCVACHVTYRTATGISWPLKSTWATPANRKCVECHDVAATRDGLHKSYNTGHAMSYSGCLGSSCHDVARGTVLAFNATNYAADGSGAAAFHSKVSTPGAATARSCGLCHKASNTDTFVSGRAGSGTGSTGSAATQCSDCHHAGGMPNHVADAPTNDIVANNGESGCTNSGAGCHGAVYDITNLTAYPQHGCTTGGTKCHSARTAEGIPVGQASIQCVNCHGNVAYSPTVPYRQTPYPNHYNVTTHTVNALDVTTNIKPIGGGTIPGATCDNCHPSASGLRAQHLGVSVEARCAGCHNNTTVNGNTNVEGRTWSTTNNKRCQACHTVGVADLNFDHGTAAPAVSILPTATYDPANCAASGTGCHGNTTDLHVVHKDASTCFGSKPGGTCHVSGSQAVMPTSKTCQTCHANYGSAHYVAANHTAGANQAGASINNSTGVGGTIRCDYCHGMEMAPEHTAKASSKTQSITPAGSTITCAVCHSAKSTVANSTGWTASKNTVNACAACHNDTGNVAVRHSQMTADHTENTLNAGCANTGAGCHYNTYDIAAIHKDCTSCHSSSKFPASKTCTNAACHGTGYTATNHNGLTGSEPTTHTGLATQAPANSITYTGTRDDSNTASFSSGAKTCSTCHTLNMTAAHDPAKTTLDHSWTAGAQMCLDCHTAAKSIATVKGAGNAWDGNCANGCHSGVMHNNYGTSHAIAAVAGCTNTGVGCHPTTDLRDLHLGVQNGTTGGCSVCHTAANTTIAYTSCAQAGCHPNHATAHNDQTAPTRAVDPTHTATGMTTSVYTPPSGGTNPGATCISCHDGSLGVSTDTTGAHNLLVGFTCASCHNATNPPNKAEGVGVVNTGWTPQTCDECHVTHGTGKHAAIDTTHTGTPPSGNTCGATTTTGCHGGKNNNNLMDLHAGGRSTHSPDPGCTATGCHTIMNGKPAAIIRNCDNASCHPGKTDNNHGGDHNANKMGTFTAKNLAGTVTYTFGSNVGCTKEGTRQGCHYADLRFEHGSVNMSDTGLPGLLGAGRGDITAAEHGTDARWCTTCHTATTIPGETAGSYVNRSNITTAIARGDKRCVACHTGGANGVSQPHTETAEFTANLLGTNKAMADWAVTPNTGAPTNSGGGHNSYPGGANSVITTESNAWPATTFGAISWPYSGTYQGTNPRTNLTWKNGDAVLCNDCHVSVAAAGPQGASVPVLLPAWRNIWIGGNASQGTNNSGANSVCANCHVNTDSSLVHGNHGTDGSRDDCEFCHVSIPHAWKRPRLLRIDGDPAPYNRLGAVGLSQIGIVDNKGKNLTFPISSASNCEGNGCAAHTSRAFQDVWE